MTTQTPDAVREAMQDLTALADLMERPPLDDVQLTQEVAVRMSGAIRTILAALDSRAGDAGEGWKLVPLKPTFEMLNAAIDTDSRKLGDISPLGFRCSPQTMFERCWSAMLAATPAPAVDAVPAGEVDWTKFAFITGFEQALHNSSMTAEDFYAEWKHAGFPGAPSALSHGEGRK